MEMCKQEKREIFNKKASKENINRTINLFMEWKMFQLCTK